MAIRTNKYPDRGNLGDDKEKLNLSKGPATKYDADTILHKNIMKIDDDTLKAFRIKHNLSGVIIIAFEDLENQPDQIRLLKSCKFKASSGIIGRFMMNIISKKQELM